MDKLYINKLLVLKLSGLYKQVFKYVVIKAGLAVIVNSSEKLEILISICLNTKFH